MAREGVIHTHMNTSHQSEWNFTIYNNIGGPWGHYAKWNKSNRERSISHDFSHMEDLKTNQSENQAYRYRGQICPCSRQGVEVGI